MSWCNDPYGEERKGRDAARWGERYDPDHRERIRNARWDSDSCDGHYARGYKREIDHQEELRQEERLEEERQEERRVQRAREDAWQEQLWAEQEQRDLEGEGDGSTGGVGMNFRRRVE